MNNRYWLKELIKAKTITEASAALDLFEKRRKEDSKFSAQESILEDVNLINQFPFTANEKIHHVLFNIQSLLLVSEKQRSFIEAEKLNLCHSIYETFLKFAIAKKLRVSINELEASSETNQQIENLKNKYKYQCEIYVSKLEDQHKKIFTLLEGSIKEGKKIIQQRIKIADSKIKAFGNKEKLDQKEKNKLQKETDTAIRLNQLIGDKEAIQLLTNEPDAHPLIPNNLNHLGNLVNEIKEKSIFIQPKDMETIYTEFKEFNQSAYKVIIAPMRKEQKDAHLNECFLKSAKNWFRNLAKILGLIKRHQKYENKQTVVIDAALNLSFFAKHTQQEARRDTAKLDLSATKLIR